MASMLLSRQLTCCLQQNPRLLVFGKWGVLHFLGLYLVSVHFMLVEKFPV